MNGVLFSDMPQGWQQWPCAIEVLFTLTPCTCVYRSLYEEYARDTCEQAAETLFDERNKSIFVHYRVHTDGFVPAFAWYATWPVLRRGKACGITARRAKGGAAPWELCPDDTLFEVWNRPNGVYGFTQTYMLRAGGRTQAEAVDNWYQCAKPLRAILKRHRLRGHNN